MGKSIPPTLSKPHLPILLKEISRLSVDFAATASLLCRGCWFPFSPFNFFGHTAEDNIANTVGIKVSEPLVNFVPRIGIVFSLGGAPLPPPPPGEHCDPREEDKEEGGNSGKCRQEDGKADAIIALVVARVAAVLLTCRRNTLLGLFRTAP